MSVCPPVFRIPCVPKLGPFSAVISQNVKSQIKVVWYVFGVKIMHSGHPDPWRHLDKAKPS